MRRTEQRYSINARNWRAALRNGYEKDYWEQHKKLRIRWIAVMDPVLIWSGSSRHIYPLSSTRGGGFRGLGHLPWQEAQVTESGGLMKGLSRDGRWKRDTCPLKMLCFWTTSIKKRRQNLLLTWSKQQEYLKGREEIRLISVRMAVTWGEGKGEERAGSKEEKWNKFCMVGFWCIKQRAFLFYNSALNSLDWQENMINLLYLSSLLCHSSLLILYLFNISEAWKILKNIYLSKIQIKRAFLRLCRCYGAGAGKNALYLQFYSCNR